MTRGEARAAAWLGGVLGLVACQPEPARVLGQPPPVPAASSSTTSASTGPVIQGLWAGEYAACARVDGAMRCWGANAGGALGISERQNSRCKDDAVECVTPPLRSARLDGMSALAIGAAHGCGAASDGTVTCWGNLGSILKSDGMMPCPATDPLCDAQRLRLGPAKGLARSNTTTCAVLANGEAWCWGITPVDPSASAEHCGPALPIRCAPRRVEGIARARDVCVGGVHACALVDDGTVQCWGEASLGELGDGGIPRSIVVRTMAEAYRGAVRVEGLERATSIACGEGFSCASRTDGRVVCWGENTVGQAGRLPEESPPCAGASWRVCEPRPTVVAGLGDVQSVAAGHRNGCALHRDGTVSCWGYVMGDPSSGPRPPERVVGIEGATRLVMGSGFACVSTRDGRVLCWGENALGQLGNGWTQDQPRPVRVRL